jgi:hypothetical protein
MIRQLIFYDSVNFSVETFNLLIVLIAIVIVA